MAGAGYKLYLTGDVLSATDVNEYLQQQTVMVFASAAARTSALSAVLAEGMISYLQDTNAVEAYNGSAWVAVGAASGAPASATSSGTATTSTSSATYVDTSAASSDIRPHAAQCRHCGSSPACCATCRIRGCDRSRYRRPRASFQQQGVSSAISGAHSSALPAQQSLTRKSVSARRPSRSAR